MRLIYLIDELPVEIVFFAFPYSSSFSLDDVYASLELTVIKAIDDNFTSFW